MTIDKAATRKRVEEALETVRVYKRIGFVRQEVKTTQSYEARYHGNTNTVNKSTERVAVANVDGEERLREWTSNVERAVQQLDQKERNIIERRYLEEDPDYDFMLCHELNMSERTYRRVKAKAFEKLAYMLRLEVVVEE
ncbi:ArpU family transcriptional regulator [Paenibacillus sp. N1-5-1-14]|uniref:ArpU family phage packaging/lysis transcriptional regulator n=1 Tax=Paenibacillus radicibacter TaxID=2972488 RepID=UPI0021599F7C|nr:ArpU family phage packaging/lysis transcriptional regulator [Paenibacillus radicibacter]MCR8645560.1 ArpU family transcriptional regulator [Paenibacillus radicibacter]